MRMEWRGLLGMSKSCATEVAIGNARGGLVRETGIYQQSIQ
jgi:hypothetical protein